MASYIKKSEVQEALLNLYLRLNGYFVTSFIVHSRELGKNLAQIDALAVRHPFNNEPERVIPTSSFLAHEDGLTDLLVCEVKSLGKPLQFNEKFREHDGAIETVLRWSGLFEESEIRPLARELKPMLQPQVPQEIAKAGFRGPRGTRVRPLLCSPERWFHYPNQSWFFPGSELFNYIADCLNPSVPRPSCSTRYDFDAWGAFLAPLVRYFKQRNPGNPGRINELYQYLQRRGDLS